MADDTPGEVTALLRRMQEGEEGARSRLFELVFGELQQVARGLMRAERPGHTLQATAIVNEAFLKLCAGRELRARDRSYFFAAAAHPPPPPPAHLVLLHDAYSYGVDAVAFTHPVLQELPARECGAELTSPRIDVALEEADYRDPVARAKPEYGEFEGRWLAGFAPVGRTGFIVVVQQRYDDVMHGSPLFR